jgi:hypothetical protein
MRLRHANIRLINRRSKLTRLLLALPSENGKNNGNNKNNPTDPQKLTGSLHIRLGAKEQFDPNLCSPESECVFS